MEMQGTPPLTRIVVVFFFVLTIELEPRKGLVLLLFSSLSRSATSEIVFNCFA